MRLLLVTDFFPPVLGGLETYTDDLAAELAARGHEVHVATLTSNPTPRSNAVHMHTLRTTSSRWFSYAAADRAFHPPIPDPGAVRGLTKLVDLIAPDVIHSHTWLGVSIRGKRAAPLVVTAHEYSLVCQLRTLLQTSGERCSGPGVIKCIACGQRRDGTPKSTLLSLGTIAGRHLLRPTVVTTLSERVKRAIAGYVRAPIVVIPGMVCPSDADEPEVTFSVPDGPYVMFAGDPGAHKGTDVLLDMWAEGQWAGLRLLVATTKPLDRAVPDGVEVRTIPRDHMASAWRKAVAAVVPSLWDEPFGMVAVEALTCGTPVVASAVGALPEIVSDGGNGLLVAPGDGNGLRGAIARLHDDHALRARLSAGAIDSARRYSPGTVVPQIESVYESALRDR